MYSIDDLDVKRGWWWCYLYTGRTWRIRN